MARNRDNHKNKLKLLYTYARSLKNKLSEFGAIVSIENPDMIAVTETWTNSELNKAEFELPGYRLEWSHGLDTSVGRGGGAAIYVRQDIPYRKIELSNDGNEFNIICIEIIQKGGKPECTTIGLIYRSSNISRNNNTILMEECDKLFRKHSIIMGDFNFRKIDWDRLNSDNEGKEFLDIVQNNFMTQFIKVPTRGDNILDLVLGSEPNMVENEQDIGKLEESYHDIVTLDINLRTVRKKNVTLIDDYKKANWQEINKILAETDWNKELGELDVNNSWTLFRTKIGNLCEKFIPKKKVKNRNRPLWMKQNDIKVIRKKRKLWDKYRQSKDYRDYLEFKSAEKEVKVQIKLAQKLFEENLVKNLKQNPKAFYSYVRSKSRTKDIIGPLKDNDGRVIHEEESMTDILNAYFCSIFTRENRFDGSLVGNKYTGKKLGSLIIKEDDVIAKLGKLKLGKSAGPDGISTTFLMNTKHLISKPLTLIYNKTITEGVVPQDWKRANVTPLFKKGSREEPGNYRPISLTSVVCKVMESILKNEILDHINKEIPINKSQHGFTANRSCLTNLIEYLEKVTEILDSGGSLDVIYLDFSKAFDRVPHQRLIHKLEDYGITGNIKMWIESWLCGRTQRVVINGSKSGWESVLSGVPQGSVLGPLLFLLFIDDIDKSVNSFLKKFADDTKVYREVNCEQDRRELQMDLDNLGNWSENSLMDFNVGKCKVMHIGSKNPKFRYKLNDKELQTVTEEKDLGVLVHNTLKCSFQCDEAVKRGNRILGMIYRNFCLLDKDNILRLYKLLVRPHLEYAVQAWSPYMVKDIEKLESVQRRATRMIQGFRNLDYKERLRRCGLTTLKTRRIRGDMIETYKILTGKEGLDKDIFFKPPHRTLGRGHDLKLYKNKCRLDVRKFFFSHRVVDEWNKLPVDVVESETLDQFKARIDRHFLERGKL